MDHYDPVHYVCQDHNSALQMPQRDKRLLPHTNALDYVGELCPMLNIDQCRKRRSPVAPCRASRSLSGGIYQCWKLGPPSRASRGLGGRSLLGDRQRNRRVRGSERRGYEHQRPEETRERQTRERIPVFAITPDNHAFSPIRFPNQFMFYNLTISELLLALHSTCSYAQNTSPGGVHDDIRITAMTFSPGSESKTLALHGTSAYTESTYPLEDLERTTTFVQPVISPLQIHSCILRSSRANRWAGHISILMRNILMLVLA